MYAVYTHDQHGDKVAYTIGDKQWCEDIANELNRYNVHAEVVDLGPDVPPLFDGDEE